MQRKQMKEFMNVRAITSAAARIILHRSLPFSPD